MDLMNAWIVYFIIAIIGITVIMYQLGPARFVIKMVVFGLGMISISMLTLILSIFTPRDIDNLRRARSSLQMLSAVLGVNFEVRGEEHIPQNVSCILVLNHQCALDFLAMAALNMKRMTWLARKENLLLGVFGLASWWCGAIHIDRSNHNTTMVTLAKCAMTLRKEKVKLWIHPEGTYTPDYRTFLPFKKGAFNMAIQAQVPVVPIVLSTWHHFYCHHQPRFDSGKIILTCLPPVSTIGMTSQDVPDLTEKVHSQMFEVYQKTSDEIRPLC